MSTWLIGLAGAAALLIGFLMLRRRPAPRDQVSPDSTTQVAAAQMAAAQAEDESEPEPEPPEPPPTEILSVRAETLRSLREVAFGTALPALGALPAPVDPLSMEIGAALGNIVDKPNYAPRRPMQLPRLMQAINDETASRGALSQIIAGDPALAGNLLRLANSPFYRHSSEPIESLDRAVAMLGIEGLRSMIAAALLQPVFRISGGSFAKFGEVTWEHSLFAASAAEVRASLVESADPFAAQLLSLILGLATIVVFSVAQDAFMAHRRAPEAPIIAALIDAHAISVARQIAASWELSERIDKALSEQFPPQALPASGLGRALQFGEFIGALAVLRSRGIIDDAMAHAVLSSVDTPSGINERIWTRLGLNPD
jgi:HD-like signal output (HDOD) protein